MKKFLILAMGVLVFTSILICDVNATPVYYSGTGHYYEAISAPGITWGGASSASQSRSYLGVNGYLATITSQGEQDFIATQSGSIDGYWLGGFQPAGSPEPAGGWQWVTGEPWVYTNWNPPAEPSNSYGGDQEIHPAGFPENALQITWWPTGGKWNDFPDDIPMYGYVVEYDTCSIVGKWTQSSFSGCINNFYPDGTCDQSIPVYEGSNTGTWVQDGNLVTIHWNFKCCGATENFIDYNTLGADCNTYSGVNQYGDLYTGSRIDQNQPPVAAFDAAPTSGSTPLKVTFTDKSTGDGITSRVWQYKLNTDTSWTTFTLNKKSSFKFTKDGVYDVKLTVTGTGGSDEELKSELLKVGCDFSTQPGIERCFGGIGVQCQGFVGVQFKKNENLCLVKGYMSVGSILHDVCCLDSGNTGVGCANPTPGTTKCLPEWMLAFDDVTNGRTWKATFGPYPAGNKGDNTNMVFQKVPSGAHVYPYYQSYCPSGSCRVDKKGNTIIKGSGAGQYCICQ